VTERTHALGFTAITLEKMAVRGLVTCTVVPVADDMHTVTAADGAHPVFQPDTADFPPGTL